MIGGRRHAPSVQGGMARAIVQRAGCPGCVTAQTVNRYCSSGLQTIATPPTPSAAGGGRGHRRRR